MTDRNSTIALIDRYYAAFNASDAAAMLDCVSDEIVHDINQGTRELGKARFKAFLSRMDTAYLEQLTDIVVMATDDGRRASAEFTVHGEYLVADEGFPAATGQRYTLSAGTFFEVDAGRIRRVSVFYNLADWINQVTS